MVSNLSNKTKQRLRDNKTMIGSYTAVFLSRCSLHILAAYCIHLYQIFLLRWQQMKANMKQILRRGALILTLTAFCITGSYIFAHRKGEAAMPTAGQESAPVIVLDAGHGEST